MYSYGTEAMVMALVLSSAKDIGAMDNTESTKDAEVTETITDTLDSSWLAMRVHLNRYTTGRPDTSKSTDSTPVPRPYSMTGSPADVNGQHLKAATVLWPPHTMKNNASGKLYGFCIDILSELSELLNFSYTLEVLPDGEFGVLKENGWSGIVGLLARKEVDMAATPLTYHAMRAEVMEYTFPFETKESKMWLLDPKGRQDRWIILFDLLDLPSALLVGAAILVLSLLLTYTAYLLNFSKRYSLTSNYSTNVFQLFGVLLGQSVKRVPASYAGKAFLGSWWMFFVTFSAMYSAILVATLSTIKTSMPFTTLDGLAKQTEYKYGYLGNSVEELIFANSNRSDMQAAWRGIHELHKSDPTVLSGNVSVHFRKILTEKYVYIGAKIPMHENGMHVISLREIFHIYSNSFGLPVDSPFQSSISGGVMTLGEHGVLQRYRRKWWPRVSSGNMNNVNTATPIPLQTVLGAFYTITSGIALCLLFLLLEIAFAYLRR